MTTAVRYRRWFEYEKDAHAKVLTSLASATESARAMEAYQKAVDLMAHLVEARRLWLFRMGRAESGPALEELFPRGVAASNLPARVREMEGAWSSYLGRQAGPEPAVTDFLFWTREPVSGKEGA